MSGFYAECLDFIGEGVWRVIRSKLDLESYLEADKVALHKCGEEAPRFFGDPIWRFQILLRWVEFYRNTDAQGLARLRYFFIRIQFKIMSLILGFTIYPNNFGKGLSIAHRGTIVVNERARIGDYCRIHVCVNIGSDFGGEGVPKIGDNVYIGPGAKIFGDISVADKVAIGANAVVNKSIVESCVAVAGVPARKIGAFLGPGVIKG